MSLVLIYSVVQILCSPISLAWLIPLDLADFGFNWLNAYSTGVYQQMSTFAGHAAMQLLIIAVINSVILFMVEEHRAASHEDIPTIVPSILAVVMFIGGIGIHEDIALHTHYQIAPSARTISVKKMGDDKIPTLNKSDTAEPLYPQTVFHEIDQNWSQVPHPNAYDIAENDNGDREIQAQYYHGKPVYIVPLQFDAYHYYHYYHKTIPGYWVVSATDPNDEPHFVHKPIKYSDSSYFHNNSDRLLYESHPEAVEISKNAQLEINDHGTPYYVETLRKSQGNNNHPNFHNLEVSVVNAETGKIHFYHHLDQAPKFADETITSDVAADIANDYGTHRGGFWNNHSFLGLWGKHQNGVMNMTNAGPEDGMTTVFHKGYISYETDMTTPGSGNSALGVLTVSGRTGHVHLYKSKGMNDADDAEDQADTAYRHGLHAHMPVPYDVKGHPTWVSVITNHSYQIEDFYYQDAHDSNIHATGSTPSSALDNYKATVASNAGTNHSSSASKSSKVKGTVDRVIASPDKVEFTLKGSKKYYEADSAESVLMHTGDKVDFKTGYHGIGHTAKDLTDSAID